MKTTICGVVAALLTSLSLTPGLTPTWQHVLLSLSGAATAMGLAFAQDHKPNPPESGKPDNTK